MAEAKCLVTMASEKLAREAERNPSWTNEDLPWRKDRTPFRVLLAEFLLIRTRADVVAAVFEDIVGTYPDLKTLASATEEELALALHPLGLRKRVPYLIRAAQYLLREYSGQIPENIDELIKIPGLGTYTAVAIAAFAYGSPRVPADVNILRFLSRLTGLPMKHPTKGSDDLKALLPLLSRDEGGPDSEILLDFTRVVCKPKRPKCSQCPMSAGCNYFASTDSKKPTQST